MGALPQPMAVGSLPAGGWVALARVQDGFRLVIGGPAGTATDAAPAGLQRATLTALAVLHFEEALDPAPADLDEATQHEMAELLEWLRRGATSAEERRLATLALDAVEDGLPGDAVALRLMPLLGLLSRTGTTSPPPDPLAVVLARARALSGP